MRNLIAAAVMFGLGLATSAHAERLTDQPLVDAPWLQAHLGNESLVVIDVRDAVNDANPYASGHVPGSVEAPYSAFGWRAKIDGVPGMLPPVEQIAGLISQLGVSNDTHVVIVSAGTDASEFGAATRVYWTFKVLGHDAVSILDGGWRAWTSAGGEASIDAVAPRKADFAAELQTQYLATTADVEQALKDGTRLVDGRPVAQYKGESKSPVARVAGTIPGAVNIDNGTLYDSANASFASKETVASLARGAGVKEDESNIAFCNTGHWASIAWFGLSEVEGNKNTRMYDGSMAEWTADPARPVE